MKKKPPQPSPSAAILMSAGKNPKNKNQKQTVGSSAGAPQTRAAAQPSKKTKEAQRRKQGTFNSIGTFLESVQGNLSGKPGRRFRVTLIKEGLGNFNDCYYYTAPALASAVPLYEGAHFFVDHPSRSEEEDRPERSVNDLNGYFEDVSIEKNADGQAVVTADLVILTGGKSDEISSKITESLQYKLKHPDKDLVGLSINASGDFAEGPIDLFIQDAAVPDVCKQKLLEAKELGITTIRPVLVFDKAVSCDLVTAAGAGGGINQLLEGRGRMSTKLKNGKTTEKNKEGGAAGKAAVGTAPAAAAGGAGAKGSNAADDQGEQQDGDSDDEVIGQMLNKYCGDGFTDDDKAAAREMYENALEMHGGDHKAAQETAGHAMAMSRHMASKQKPPQDDQNADQDPSGDGDGSQQTESDSDKALGAHSPNPVAPGKQPSRDQQVQESNRSGNAGKEMR